jgi:hypothetical protein
VRPVGAAVQHALRFIIVLGIAALCGLAVYVGGWFSARLFFLAADAAGLTISGPLWGFVGFVPGALLGAGAAYLMVLKFRIGAGHGEG